MTYVRFTSSKDRETSGHRTEIAVASHWGTMPHMNEKSESSEKDVVQRDRPACILIVDDDAMSRELLRDALEPMHYRIIEAPDGVDALRMLDTETADLMLVDIQMPHMSGFEFLTKVREDDKLAHIPVVAVTAYAMVGDDSRVLRHGFDRYLSKPVPIRRLRQTVEDLLRSSEPGAAN